MTKESGQVPRQGGLARENQVELKSGLEPGRQERKGIPGEETACAEQKSGTRQEVTNKMPPDSLECPETHTAGQLTETAAEGS